MTRNILYSIATLALAMGCSRLDVLESRSTSMPIVYKVNNVSEVCENDGTKATLVTTGNVELLYDEMTVKAVRRNTSAANDDVMFTDSFVPSTSETTSLNQMWKEDSYVFYSYPSDAGITPSFADNAMVFNVTVSKDSKTTPDIILARTAQTRGNDVAFTYRHIFTAVNVIYKTAKMGHKITKIAITNTPTTGKCRMADDGNIYWEQQASYADLVDENIRYATYNGQEVTEDGCKFMTIPGKAINIEVVIDGITLTKSCEAKKAGDIVNFYIEDDFEIKKEDGSAAEGTVEKNLDGTYKMTLDTYVTGDYKTTIVHKPVDFILVLDYSESMTKSYTDTKTTFSGATVTKRSYNDWKANKTGYKVSYNGTSYTVTCLDIKNSGTDNIHWAYITVSGKRYYIGMDGSLYESTNLSPSMSNPPVSTDGITIFPSVGGTPALWGEVTFSSKKLNTRITALQSAVTDFLAKVEEDARTNNVTHRVSIVEFKNYIFPTYTGQSSGRKDYRIEGKRDYLRQCHAESSDNQNKQSTGILYPFRDIQELNTMAGIKAAMSLTATNGVTAIDYGMYIASLQIKNCRADAAKTVVVFTDGKPTHAGSSVNSDSQIPGYSDSSSGTTKTDDQVADGAVRFAKDCKDAGATVFTIGVFNSTDKPKDGFMDALSSNYPHATSVSNKGEGSTEWGYYQDASSSSLAQIFEAIALTSIELSLDITKDAYVTAVISDAFILPEDYIEGSGNMKFYECAQTGYDSAKKKILWSGTQTDITNQITCTMDAKTQTISITGFDYAKNFCICDSAGPFTGKKLIMVFNGLVANPEREGTGKNQAIEYTTGLYDEDGNPVTMFDPLYIEL